MSLKIKKCSGIFVLFPFYCNLHYFFYKNSQVINKGTILGWFFKIRFSASLNKEFRFTVANLYIFVQARDNIIYLHMYYYYCTSM